MGTTAEKLAYLQETKTALITVLTNKLHGFITFDASEETFLNLCTKYVDAIGANSIKNDMFSSCLGLRNINYPSGISHIGSRAFQGCRNLGASSIPNGVTSIGSYAYSGCNAPTFSLPNGLQTIGDYAFSENLIDEGITIPSSVTSIGKKAFAGCGDPTPGTYASVDIHMKSVIPPSLGSSAFSNIYGTLTIYVPSTSLNEYKTASGWNNYANKIYAEYDE